jgi:hypothetical protein
MTRVFPAEFKHLEKFSAWALPTESERLNKKCKTPMAEIQAVYDALAKDIDTIIAYLNKFPFDNLPDDAKRLMDLACCLTTFDVSVSGWGKPDLDDVFPIERWEFVEERW